MRKQTAIIFMPILSFATGATQLQTSPGSASDAGMRYFAFTPHSPVPIESTCNMPKEKVGEYFEEVARVADLYCGKMDVLTSFEIDYLGDDWGPHIDYFQNMPLDFRLGSVHFVPNQEGVFLDCDGRFERFADYLKNGFNGDLRYVVEKYFEQVLTMLERGGIDLLGHFDKIAGNASMADPEIENQGWYEALIDDVVGHVKRHRCGCRGQYKSVCRQIEVLSGREVVEKTPRRQSGDSR